MLYAIGKTATIRNGAVVPGGKAFEISVAEVEGLKASGFEILSENPSDRPEVDSINILTKNKPSVNPVLNLEKISETIESPKASPKVLSGGSSKSAKPMGGTSAKAKVATKVSAQKES